MDAFGSTFACQNSKWLFPVKSDFNKLITRLEFSNPESIKFWIISRLIPEILFPLLASLELTLGRFRNGSTCWARWESLFGHQPLPAWKGTSHLSAWGVAGSSTVLQDQGPPTSTEPQTAPRTQYLLCIFAN